MSKQITDERLRYVACEIHSTIELGTAPSEPGKWNSGVIKAAEIIRILLNEAQ